MRHSVPWVPLLLPVLLVACGNNPPPRTGGEVTASPPPVSSGALKRASPSMSVGADIAEACKLEVTKPTDAPKFDFDSTELLPEDVRVLDQIAQCFTTGPLKGRHLALVGRADPRGTVGYNLALGAKRAHQVSEYLEHKGVSAPSIKETSRGDLDATGKDESGWSVDRRVDVVLAP